MNLKWGIIGYGKIAKDFISDLLLSSNNTLYGIASRSQERAFEAQKKYQLKKAYTSYQSILEDESIDIIYIATPHDSHAKWSMEAMNHGKHVLCEKPAGINARELKDMISCSKKNQVFFMEALWTRFNPNIVKMLDLIKAGAIGQIRHISADFCFYKAYENESRLFNINRAGGALLDIGIYPIFLSYIILGKPEKVYGQSILHEGVDLQSSGTLHYKNAQCNFLCSTLIPSKADATILGEHGQINIESRWHETNKIELITEHESVEIIEGKKGRGFFHEIEECFDCISQKKTESENWSHQNSLDLVSIMDEIRVQNSIKYPSE